MVVGLSTPLHLAASLLTLSAAVGLGLVAFAAVRRRRGVRPWRIALRSTPGAVVIGAALFAFAHLLAGILVDPGGVVVGWLRALGLALVAVGLLRRGGADLVRAPDPQSESVMAAGSALLVPLTSAPAALVATVCGAVAGLRMLIRGRDGLALGVGLLAWAGAAYVGQTSPAAGSWLSIVGAVAVGLWVWQVSARSLAARFVTAFIASVIGVVVLVAGVLSGIGSVELVDEELNRLDGFAALLAAEISQDWPDEAIAAARPLSASGERLLALDSAADEELRAIYDLSFRQQDFVLVFDGAGELLAPFAVDPELVGDGFLLQVAGAPIVDGLLAEATEDGAVLTIGGRLVALGGVPLTTGDAVADDPPEGALLTGRVVDELWVQRVAGELGVEVLVESAGALSVAETAVEVPSELVAELEGDDDRRVITVGERTRHAAARAVRDPTTGSSVGRVVVATSADALADLEREQTRRLFLLALAGALLAALAIASLTNRLVEPVRRLTRAAIAVREGDLDVSSEVDTPDEVGELGRTFDEMTASLAAQSNQLRRAAEVEARLRSRLEALTESMSDALIAVDPSGVIVTFNPAAEELTGTTAAEAVGQPLAGVLTRRGSDGPDVANAVGASDSAEPAAAQLALVRSNGEVVQVAATAAPVRAADGSISGRVLVLRDVTREVEVERMKTQFLSNVSHELRTPLTPIKGYAEVLTRRDLGADATQRYAGEILDATRRLERVVAQIVDFAALDSGRLRLRPEPTSLDRLVGELLTDWRERCPDQPLRRRLARDLPLVLVDPTMLRRCLDELVDNAVKFSPEAEAITITAEAVNTDGVDVVRLSVRDRGVGIDTSTAEALFADFRQADASETRHYGGLGLGLALVQRIVDGLGGTITVDGELGKGTTVDLWLPVAEGAGGVNGGSRQPAPRASNVH